MVKWLIKLWLQRYPDCKDPGYKCSPFLKGVVGGHFFNFKKDAVQGLTFILLMALILKFLLK